MKQFLFVLALLMQLLVCQGQSIALQLIGSNGFVGSMPSGVHVHSSVGELQVAPYTGAGLTPGLQQIFLSGTIGFQQPALDVDIQLFPNPAVDWCLLIAETTQTLQVSLFDLNGILIQDGTVLNGSPLRFELNSLPAGEYFIQVSNLSYATRVLRLLKI
ncbi:MAG: T9SS type A sorting domain-containing protein [Saprospiraceae bacterium]